VEFNTSAETRIRTWQEKVKKKSIDLFYTIFFSVSTKFGVKRSFKKGHQTWVTINCTHLAIFFFFFSFKPLFINLQTLPNALKMKERD